jgi:hypothetical protein
MSTVSGGQGNIVTNGLVLNLDAANPRSYPQPYNGTTWQNIAPISSSLTGSLVGGVTYTGSNGGALVFDGVNDYVNLGPLSLIQTDFCISLWVRMTSLLKENYIFSTGYSSANSIIIFDGGIWLNSSEASGRMPIIPDTSLNQIINIVVTRTGPTASWYKNGILQSTLLYSGSIATGTTYTIGWAIPRNKPEAYLQGNFYLLHIYNRGLNPSEVLQNFNATRARFAV